MLLVPALRFHLLNFTETGWYCDSMCSQYFRDLVAVVVNDNFMLFSCRVMLLLELLNYPPSALYHPRSSVSRLVPFRFVLLLSSLA